MEIPFIPSIGQTSDQDTGTKRPLSLRAGETVRAIVQSASDGSVLLRLKNSLIEAKTDLPLSAGQVLFLQVSTLGDQIELRITSGQAAADAALTDALFTTLADLKNIGPAAADIEQLMDFLGTIPEAVKKQLPELAVLEKLMVPVETLDGKLLEKAVLNSGVLFETKLRLIAEKNGPYDAATSSEGTQIPGNDLKGVLLKIKNALDDTDTAAHLRDVGLVPQQLDRTLDRLIGAIEYQQVQSKLGESLQLFLPMLWKELTDEWIKFKKTGRGNDEPSYSCTLNLDFEQSGKLRSQILFQSGHVHVTMQCDNTDFVNTLREHADLLGKQFEVAGLKLGGVVITHHRDLDFTRDIPERLDIRI